MTTKDPIEASPCKLRNGNWGCRTAEPIEVGDTVRIVTRANKQWDATVSQVVWTNDEVWICETESKDRSASETDRSKPARSAASKDARDADAANAGASRGTSKAPPRTDAAPTEDLDAMADEAAARDEDHDDLMNAFEEFEREQKK